MKNHQSTITNQQLAIKLVNISKEYIIHHEKPTFVEKITKRSDERFLALDTVNLTIRRGDKVGIIGPNGSGKTTLLKIISSITTPTKGTVYTSGRITSLIELSAGFHPELTGIENIYLQGMVVGMSKNEIKHKIDSIIELSDIKQFIDVPLFTYSLGMILRLGFSIAYHTNPDILILDEGISAGDERFQKQINRLLNGLFLKNITIIVCSHWLDFIKKHCHMIVHIERGHIVNIGDFRVIYGYMKKMHCRQQS